MGGSYMWCLCQPSIGVVLAIAQIGLVVLFLELFGAPSRRGFFCNDESIQYPYQRNTVSEGVIIIIALCVPFLFILVTEFWKSWKGCEDRVKIWCISLPLWLTKGLTTFGYYALGLGLCQIASCVGKFTIGRLRPHFMAVCKPDVVCSPSNNIGYIQDYKCTGVETEVIEARLSFPSGHASLAFFFCVYLIIYLQSTKNWKDHGFLRCAFQFFLILTAWWISLSRVMDYWHHWSDVFAGAILGILSGYWTATYLPGIEKKSGKSLEEFLPLQSRNPTRPSSHSSSQ